MSFLAQGSHPPYASLAGSRRFQVTNARSEVQIHKYGNVNTTPYKCGNNAHAHKSLGKHGESGTTELSDTATSVHPHSADAHIGLKNPKDFPTISGRPHGS